MSAALEVQKAVVAALKADATFGSLAGDRIYARVPDDVTDPYSHVVSVTAQPGIETIDGEGVELVMRIDTWARLGTTVQQVIDAQKAAIHNQSLALDTLTNVIGQELQQIVRRADGVWFQGVHRFRFITE